MKITKRVVDGLTLPASGQALVWDSELKGFGVRLTPSGISYIAQGRIKGTGATRRVTLGKHGVLTAQEARAAAKEYLRDMGLGIDPVIARKRAEAAKITLGAVADTYAKNKKTREGHPLKDSTRADISKHIEGTFRPWRDAPITSITEDMVLSLYKDAAQRSVAQANQAFRILRALINWAAAKSPAAGTIPRNPVRILKGEWGHVPARNGKIPAPKFGLAWNRISGLREWGSTGADVAAFLLVTGARFTEAATLLWSDVNLSERFWRLSDPKNRRPVMFPLSSVALDILESKPQVSEYVFPGLGNRGHAKDIRATMDKISAAIGERITPHDLRRSFVLAAGYAGVEFVKCKLLMGHRLSGDVTVSHYADRADLRWLAADAEKIAAWIVTQGRIAAAGNVVDITARRAG